MNIGRLRHKCALYLFSEKMDSYGEPIKTYTHVTDFYAEIRPLKGYEAFDEKEVHTEHTHKILCRYFNLPLDATMQIRYDNRVFEVDGAPSNWQERNISWTFNVKVVFEHA